MLQFVHSIWLYASAAVVAPLIIHLWNDRRGKAIRIGSIAFLSKQSRRQSRNIRITEWLLLLLRCLLLVALSLLLAQPRWRSADAVASAKKGLILIGDSSAAAANRVMIDSLIQQGYSRQPMSLIDDNWWNSFSEADRQAPATTPLYIFTDGLARHFHGPRPLTERSVHWYTYADTGSVYTKDIAVWASGQDSMSVITLTSRATGSAVSYRSSVFNRHTSPDTSRIRVAVIADPKYANDARYVIEGIRALRQLTHRNIDLSVNEGAAADWTFCLSDSIRPAYKRSRNLLVYAPGREVAADTWISGTDIAVTRRINAAVYEGGSVWTDAQGKGLLMRQERGDSNVYYCYTRFNPQYGGLVWSVEWPIFIKELLFGDSSFPDSNDRRTLDPQQILPGKGLARDAGMDISIVTPAADWSQYAWLIVFILLSLERLVSYQNKKLSND